jgi:hypothetical protein
MPSTASTSVVWADRPEPFPGDRVAVVALDRAGWEALGARFFDIEDALGGTSRLATGRVEGPEGAQVRFGALDHDEDASYLLAATWDDADAVIVALVAAGLSPAAILTRIPEPPAPSLEARVLTIERWIDAQRSRA